MGKTIVQINGGTMFSTGDIMFGIAELARNNGYKMYTFSPNGRSQKKGVENHAFIGTIAGKNMCQIINNVSGMDGNLLYFATGKFLKQLDKLKPDIIHIHNLHGGYVNHRMLFDYIKKNKIKTIWTLHDCWAFTGNCPYFTILKCEKWKTHCTKCAYRGYPKSKGIDRGYRLYDIKKRIFTSLDDMVIVTPSAWLADLTRQSFLNKYPIRILNNGIDLDMFHPAQNDMKKQYCTEGKFVVLGAASAWGYRKGLDRFERLAGQLDDRFQILLVGLLKEQVSNKNIICIPRTSDKSELCRIYSAADVFLNPTREDNFPTINMEVLACGTPILSYGAGGSAEAFDEKSGCIVDDDSVVAKLEELYIKNYDSVDCCVRARMFDRKNKFAEYIALYNELA